MRLLFGISLIGITVLLLSSCGKYGPPLPPEAYAPSAVENLVVTAGVSGVDFSWKTPDTDLRGRVLHDLAYFDVKRAETENLATFLKDPIEESERVGRVPDVANHLLEKMRGEARAKKIPARKVKIDPELLQYHFVDEEVSPGKTYIYAIVPVTENKVPGEVAEFVRVRFSGLTSQVELLKKTALDKPYTLDF